MEMSAAINAPLFDFSAGVASHTVSSVMYTSKLLHSSRSGGCTLAITINEIAVDRNKLTATIEKSTIVYINPQTYL